MDFYKVKVRPGKRKGEFEIYADYKVGRARDLMVRGGKFYAVWDEKRGMWSSDDYDVQRIVDSDLEYEYERQTSMRPEDTFIVKFLQNDSTNAWKNFLAYVKSLPDNAHQLDEKLTFQSTQVKRTDYVSMRLPYDLEDGDTPAWNEMMSVLYAPEELEKLEWAVGAIVAGESRHLQKFIVLYGDRGTGKSTFLNIVSKLFDGYWKPFDAKALGQAGNRFCMEPFKDNPMIAIQHDGDLSKIEDNTRLNSIVSHETMVIDIKNHNLFSMRLNSFLFIGTNTPVKISDAKSGLLRRLITVTPTGAKIPRKRYDALYRQVDFELGKIAKHCLDVYKRLGKNYYQDYIPLEMMFQTDVFFNFVEDSYPVFLEENGTTLKAAYAMYKTYCDESNIDKPLPRYKFREELKNYFKEFQEMTRIDGKQYRSYYRGFLTSKFEKGAPQPAQSDEIVQSDTPDWLAMSVQKSVLDSFLKDCPAQYATADEAPKYAWANCRTYLRDIDTAVLHYVKPISKLIVIDFDLKDANGNKSLALNLKAASQWPPTYAEVSKGGQGLHLHYIYDGDVSRLSALYDDNIEVKVFTGGSSLRRRLSVCNSLAVAHIATGLRLKEEKMVNFDSIKNEKMLRALIAKNLRKEIVPSTRQSIDLIAKDLEEAKASGMHFDVSDMRPSILAFASRSSHQSLYCVGKVAKMVFSSEEPSESGVYEDDRLVFFDVEVFPNLFLVCWKYAGKDQPVAHMINPKPADIEDLLHYKLVGFNCRRYDNHILYACFLGKTNQELYELSQRIISGSRNAMFGEAYALSYTDVYDFCSVKQSLKKWEIELGIHHQELGLPWDQPVDENLWGTVADYCDNDVLATEAVFDARQADWTARQILADVADMTVNDTTNSLTQRILFGTNRSPQAQFNYRFLGTEDYETYSLPYGDDDIYTSFDSKGRPVFPGYKFDHGVSTYRDEVVGEGGYVYSEPGMYRNVALLDIASMHPSSIVAENLFGDTYTARFKELLDIRIAIKHSEFDKVRHMLDGKLAKYLDDESRAKDLAKALKIAINSVYGLTSAKFENAFRDPRNADNIVAKRGALFMINLKHEVQDRGFTVAHIKTDSIKIPEATPEIIQFVMDYGKMYGYNFELESTYDRMCLINKAVYIAYGGSGEHAGEWVAVGDQFQQPYVFKTLFSKEPIVFSDLCETKTVSTALYLDMNEDLADGEHNYVFIGKAGSFCPVIDGAGGGWLVREKDGKYDSAAGAKGYRWLEAEVVRSLHKEAQVDRRYHQKLVDDAVAALSEYGDFEMFRSVAGSPEPPPWVAPCGDAKTDTCFDCENYHPETGCKHCDAGYDLSAEIKENEND